MQWSNPIGPEMIRPLFAALAAVLLAGCAHMPLGASESNAAETNAAETDRPAILPIMPAQDPEAALMLGVLVGEMAVRSGQYEEAARYYGAAALLSDDPAIAERATRIALFAQDRNQALQSSERWRQLAPESLDALQLSTVLRLDLGQPDPAAQQMGEVIDLQAVQGGDPYAALGAVVGQTRNREAALEALRKLTDQRQGRCGRTSRVCRGRTAIRPWRAGTGGGCAWRGAIPGGCAAAAAACPSAGRGGRVRRGPGGAAHDGG